MRNLKVKCPFLDVMPSIDKICQKMFSGVFVSFCVCALCSILLMYVYIGVFVWFWFCVYFLEPFIFSYVCLILFSFICVLVRSILFVCECFGVENVVVLIIGSTPASLLLFPWWPSPWHFLMPISSVYSTWKKLHCPYDPFPSSQKKFHCPYHQFLPQKDPKIKVHNIIGCNSYFGSSIQAAGAQRNDGNRYISR